MDLSPNTALQAWNRRDVVRRAPDDGLINQTFLVGDPPWGVLQWVNPVFPPEIHMDMEAVTRRLEEAGLVTPRLLPCVHGDLWHEGRDGVWRLLTYIEGRTFHHLECVSAAGDAGRLVGLFHHALSEWTYRFRVRQRVVSHDTRAIMATLATTLESTAEHPLLGEAGSLGARILDSWDSWEGPMDLPARACHGDLKVSNLLFDGSGKKAICLVDLDTLGPLPIPLEMGDAWRSWCNPAPEDDAEAARLDLDLFAASARGWLRSAPDLTETERLALVPSLERICLELAARFCADAINNSYFQEDRQRFPVLGSHNLQKARAQFRLANSARHNHSACEALLPSR